MKTNRKSDKQKALEGTARNDRKRTRSRTTRKAPVPPMKLTGRPAKIYDNLIGHLLDNDVLQAVDSYLVYQAARCIDRLLEYEAALDEVGAIQTFENGTQNISPQLTAFDRERKAFYDVCGMLGIGIKFREKILSFSRDMTPDDDDPLLNLGR